MNLKHSLNLERILCTTKLFENVDKMDEFMGEINC